MAAVDLDGAAALFDRGVVGYGTKANEALGLDVLMANQWRQIWPNIDRFAFDHEGAHVWSSPDGLLGVIAAGWRSLGRRADGTTFPRRGRATVVVGRAGPAEPWLGLHTHVSLEPVDPATFVPEAGATGEESVGGRPG